MKFLADEHIDLPAVKALEKIGTDILSVQETGKKSCTDEEILSYCKENRRIMVTSDSDYLRLHTSGVKHLGIVFLTKPLNTSELIKEIQKVILLFEDLENAVIFIPLKV